MQLTYRAFSIRGLRPRNEDMALVDGRLLRDGCCEGGCTGNRAAWAVADGMGAYGGGDTASTMALQSLDSWFSALPQGLSDSEVVVALQDWFDGASRRIYTYGATRPGCRNMGCTLCGLLLYDGRLFIINAGDSRIWRIRYGVPRLLTTDHSERARRNDPSVPQNIIYNAMGLRGAFADIIVMDAVCPGISGDRYLVCTDGLQCNDLGAFGMVPPTDAADNVTVIEISVG